VTGIYADIDGTSCKEPVTYLHLAGELGINKALQENFMCSAHDALSY
jgi:hypothetical protein